MSGLNIVRTIFWMLGFLVETIALTSAAVRQVEPAPPAR